jgi:uncharacterized membrane protein
MFTRLLTLWAQIQASLWVLPVTMVVVAIGIAILVLGIRLDIGDDPVWFLYSGTAKNAPAFLSSLVSSMITMATLVISITMVVLTLAAQQLGPRLILSFMADRRTQAVIGLFIATVVYLLLIMRATNNDANGTPNLAITLGTALVLLSVVTLPVFVHHLARSIIADVMIERVGESLDRAARDLLPEKNPESGKERPASLRETGAPIQLERGGYIAAIDYDHLVSAACEADVTVELSYRAGHHTISGCDLGWVSPPSELTDDMKQALRNSIIFGSVRTPVQDLEYSVRQLVEIALRALSPGVNDPYTALAAIDRLALSLPEIMHRGSAQSVWTDGDGTIRVVVPESTFGGTIDAAFNEIRQVGASQPAILIRLAEKFWQLAEIGSAEQRQVLRTHLNLVLDAGRRTIKDQYDLNTLENRVSGALELCES